jgi:hypothetical protein
MSPNASARRIYPLILLLVSLVLATLPAQAMPVPRSGPERAEVAVLGAKVAVWLRDLVMALWPDASKEGMSIDPDGRDGSRQGSDEGVTIDPNG